MTFPSAYILRGVNGSFSFCFISISSCKKDDPIYDINQIQSNSYNANKTKLKTPGQYISILYANLFQQALSANELVEITRCIESVGDKEIVHEVIISNFMNKRIFGHTCSNN